MLINLGAWHIPVFISESLTMCKQGGKIHVEVWKKYMEVWKRYLLIIYTSLKLAYTTDHQIPNFVVSIAKHQPPVGTSFLDPNLTTSGQLERSEEYHQDSHLSCFTDHWMTCARCGPTLALWTTYALKTVKMCHVKLYRSFLWCLVWVNKAFWEGKSLLTRIVHHTNHLYLNHTARKIKVGS